MFTYLFLTVVKLGKRVYLTFDRSRRHGTSCRFRIKGHLDTRLNLLMLDPHQWYRVLSHFKPKVKICNTALSLL